MLTEERFEYARRLKSAASALTAAGVRVGRWRLRQRSAAARDQYEVATRMRDRVRDAMRDLKEDQELEQLLEQHGVCLLS